MSDYGPPKVYFNKEEMLLSQREWLRNTFLLAIAGLCSFVIFAWPATRLYTPGFLSEIDAHSQLLSKLDQYQVPPYSLWYLFQKLLVGSQLSESMLSASGLLLIGAFATLKGVILSGLLRSALFSPLWSLVGGILLGTAVALPLPFLPHVSPLIGAHTEYLGTIPANTFMSATQLVANVCALPALYSLQQWCQKPSNRSFAMALLMCCISMLAKPGIAPPLFVAICGCTVFHCWKSRRWQVRRQTLLVFVSAVVLLVPSAVISYFYLNGVGFKTIKAIFAPLVIWQAYSPYVGLDFLRSFAFPLVVVVACLIQLGSFETSGRAKHALVGLLPGFLAASFAVFIYVSFAEQINGEYLYSGNFIWAAVSVNAGWHLNCLIATKSLDPVYRIVPLAILCLEAIGGFSYLSHYVSSGSYY
jgi:hypothetical protein